MKRGIVGIIVLLAMTGIAGAQEPAVPPGAFGRQMVAAGDLEQGPATTAKPPRAAMPPGQPDLGKWWKNSDVVRELQLSEAQINQLEQAFMDHRLKLIDLRATVEREEIKLQPLIEADQLDMPKVSAQLDAVLAARAQLEKQNTMMMLSLRKVLTVEQWKKLQALHEQRERGWRGYAPPALGPDAPLAPARPRTPPPEPRPPAPPEP